MEHNIGPSLKFQKADLTNFLDVDAIDDWELYWKGICNFLWKTVLKLT